VTFDEVLLLMFWFSTSWCTIQADHSPGKPGKVRGSEIRCVFSSYKYSKTRFSAGALPLTQLVELTMLPQTS